MCIVFDTETTGLPKSGIVDLAKQPHIIEFAAIKLDDKTLEEIDRLEFLVNPLMSLPKGITKLTGITDKDLIDKPVFDRNFLPLVKFFIGEKYLIAHNISFDVRMLALEMRRLGKLTSFPWTPIQICTCNKTIHFTGYRLKLGQLYERLFSEEMTNSHRAIGDVEALVRITKELITKQEIKIC